jgi:hypothetical protein
MDLFLSFLIILPVVDGARNAPITRGMELNGESGPYEIVLQPGGAFERMSSVQGRPKALIPAGIAGERLFLRLADNGDRMIIDCAKVLVARSPKSAFPLIGRTVHSCSDEWIRTALVKLLSEQQDDRVLPYLQGELEEGPILKSRIIAAGELASRGDRRALMWLVREWRSRSAESRWEDGWQEVLLGLSTSREPLAIHALTASVQKQPVEVRMEIVEAFDAQVRKRCVETGSVRESIDTFLFSLLEDDCVRPMLIGGADGRECRNPRICDMAAQVLVVRLGKSWLFDICGELHVRDRQLEQLRKLRSLRNMMRNGSS